MEYIINIQKYLDIPLKHITVNETRITDFVKDNKDGNFDNTPESDFLSGFEFSNIEEKVNFLFLFNLVNFCFWNSDGVMVEKDGKVLKRTEAVKYLLYQAISKDGYPYWNDLRNIDFADFLNKFEFIGKLNLPRERWKNVVEGSMMLSKSFNSNIMNLIEAGEFDSIKILELIKQNFNSFNDQAVYNGTKVEFYKRAQIFIKQLNGFAELPKKIKNIDKLTIFADYRIPQILRHLGILEYSEQLGHRIDNFEQIEMDSDEELEIRIATLIASYKIIEKFKESGINLSMSTLDFILWSKSRTIDESIIKPHHRTLSIYY